MNTQKVWLVTGASKGLGLSLIRKLLAAGYKVAATSRSLPGLTGEVDPSPHFLPLQVDLTDEQSVRNAMDRTISAFGTVSVVVNNAGYGQLGTLEELSDGEARRNFEINVFGSLNVIRQVMPHLRREGTGAIFNISSIGGFFGNFPGWGIYCATKYAVAGFTEALSAEARAFGISATVVYPGYFRTAFLTPESIGLPANPIEDYEEARASQAVHENEINGNQQGDPDRAAQVLIDVAEGENPPLHLFLGPDAYHLANVKIKAVQKDMAAMEKLATATSFAEVEAV